MRKVLYILGELSDTDMEWLFSHGRSERHAVGDVLIERGLPVSGLYIVIEGQLGVTPDKSNGKIIARLGPGEMVGEMSFIEGRRPSVYVRVLEPSLILRIPRDQLQERLRADDGFAARFYRALTLFLSQRLRGTTSQLGYGDTRELDAINDDPDELGDGVLDNVYLAGTRFEELVRRLKTS